MCACDVDKTESSIGVSYIKLTRYLFTVPFRSYRRNRTRFYGRSRTGKTSQFFV